MKKLHFKTKLVLNSQTIRRLQPEGMQGVQGGRPLYPVNDSEVVCLTDACSAGCRNCG